jgi:hypothetical protein
MYTKGLNTYFYTIYEIIVFEIIWFLFFLTARIGLFTIMVP